MYAFTIMVCFAEFYSEIQCEVQISAETVIQDCFVYLLISLFTLFVYLSKSLVLSSLTETNSFSMFLR